MKVGILTFHRAENFGAVMQAYALQTFLERLGHNSNIVDYRCKAIELQYDILNPRILFSRKNLYLSLREYVRRFKTLKLRRIKKKHYEQFRKQRLKLIGIDNTNECDVFITGSDQVWNLYLTNGFDSMYYLSNHVYKGKSKVAYAVSCDVDPHDRIKRDSVKINNALREFKAISTREEYLNQLLSSITKSNSYNICVDPTLLLDEVDYSEFMINPKISKYNLIYQMSLTPYTNKIASKLSTINSYHNVEVFGGYSKEKSDNERTIIPNPSPEELLSLIRYAESVVTTSFHGIAFSILFKKEFWLVDAGNNERQKYLLKKLGLENRIITKYNFPNFKDKIDYEKVYFQLDQFRNQSKEFLKNALK